MSGYFYVFSCIRRISPCSTIEKKKWGIYNVLEKFPGKGMKMRINEIKNYITEQIKNLKYSILRRQAKRKILAEAFT